MKGFPEASWGVITVKDVATLLRPENPKRKELLITNSSSTILYVGTNDQVTSGAGVNIGYEVLPQGTFYGNYKGAIWGIISSGTATLTYWEEDEDE